MTETEKGATVRIPPPVLFLGSILVAVPIQRMLLPLPAPFGFVPRVVIGSLVAILGLGLLATCALHFKRTGQDPTPWKPTPEILSHGPYRFSRNPMYVAFALFQVGFGLAVGNPWMLLLMPLSLIAVHFAAVRPEEAYLEEKFGEGYLKYKSSVRRYL